MTNMEWFYEHFGWRMAEPNDDLPPENGVSDSDDGSNDANAPESARERSESAREQPDSREKLEADIAETIDFWGAAYPDARVRVVIEWLDRQAAITRREHSPEAIDHMLNTIGEQEERIAELTAEVDKLTAEREEYRALCGKMLGVAQELRVVLEAWEGMR